MTTVFKPRSDEAVGHLLAAALGAPSRRTWWQRLFRRGPKTYTHTFTSEPKPLTSEEREEARRHLCEQGTHIVDFGENVCHICGETVE